MMAKKKKKKGVAGVKSRAKSILYHPLVPVAGGILGFVMADKINAQIDKVVPANVDSKIVAGGQIGIGALVAIKLKKKTPLAAIGRFTGGVMAGAGAKRGLKAFGIGGFYNVPGVNGFYDVKAVSSARRFRSVNGPWPMDGALNRTNARSVMNGSFVDSSMMY